MILTDKQIKEYVEKYNMIEPFIDSQVSNGKISYGLSSCGYDIRLGDEFRIYKNNKLIDPKNTKEFLLYKVKRKDKLIIKPNQYVLARSVERFNIPEDIFVLCIGKSTYARTGLIINLTPIENSWKGVLTIEISNPTNHSIVIYPYEGIAQLIFFKTEVPNVTYEDKNGIYQNQTGIWLPKVRGGDL